MRPMTQARWFLTVLALMSSRSAISSLKNPAIVSLTCQREGFDQPEVFQSAFRQEYEAVSALIRKAGIKDSGQN